MYNRAPKGGPTQEIADNKNGTFLL